MKNAILFCLMLTGLLLSAQPMKIGSQTSTSVINTAAHVLNNTVGNTMHIRADMITHIRNGKSRLELTPVQVIYEAGSLHFLLDNNKGLTFDAMSGEVSKTEEGAYILDMATPSGNCELQIEQDPNAGWMITFLRYIEKDRQNKIQHYIEWWPGAQISD
jgi:hypothetical protein